MAIQSKMSHRHGASSHNSQAIWVWVALALLLVCLIGGWFYFNGGDSSTAVDVEPTTTIDRSSSEYQAVFLDNGQVYFGQLGELDDVFVTLTDVFYLQSGVDIDQTTNVALTKLGNEAHGPEDLMTINVDHILFIENMRNDSKVVRAIEQYKAQNNL